MTIKRRQFVLALAVAAVAGTAHAGEPPLVTIHLNPSCGCCGAWMDHLRANGFRVKSVAVEDTADERKRRGIPAALGSCHTGIVGGYAIEGHVPAREIKRLLAVPGMPQGSPGMESPTPQRYNVLLVGKDGRHSVYARY